MCSFTLPVRPLWDKITKETDPLSLGNCHFVFFWWSFAKTTHQNSIDGVSIPGVKSRWRCIATGKPNFMGEKILYKTRNSCWHSLKEQFGNGKDFIKWETDTNRENQSMNVFIWRLMCIFTLNSNEVPKKVYIWLFYAVTHVIHEIKQNQRGLQDNISNTTCWCVAFLCFSAHWICRLNLTGSDTDLSRYCDIAHLWNILISCSGVTMAILVCGSSRL